MIQQTPGRRDHWRLCVVKVGSSSLTTPAHEIDRAQLQSLASQVGRLWEAGCQTVLVTSGAVACGLPGLGLAQPPGPVRLKQAAAAIGQGLLMQHYCQAFGRQGRAVAQILVTREDLTDPGRQTSIRDTLRVLLLHGVVPIINENDTVADEEIRLGDNDELSSFVALLLGADALILLTDAPGLLRRAPQAPAQEPGYGQGGDPALIQEVPCITPEILRLGQGHGPLGSGGMQTKLSAAARVTQAGAWAFVAGSRSPDVLWRLYEGQPAGTCFWPQPSVGPQGVQDLLEPLGGVRR